MIREVKFESQDRRMKQILAALNENGIKDIEEANAICDQYGLDPYLACEETQPICFENAIWAYTVGSAIALKKGCKKASEAISSGRASVYRALELLSEAGIISYENKKIILHDPEGLERISK